MILNIITIANLVCMIGNYLWGSTDGMILNGFCAVALLLINNNLD